MLLKKKRINKNRISFLVFCRKKQTKEAKIENRIE